MRNSCVHNFDISAHSSVYFTSLKTIKNHIKIIEKKMSKVGIKRKEILDNWSIVLDCYLQKQFSEYFKRCILVGGKKKYVQNPTLREKYFIFVIIIA